MVALTDAPFEATTTVPAEETKAERKARLAAEKAAAKQAKADEKAARKAAKQAGKEAAVGEKTDKQRAEEERLEAKLERYRRLRASVRNRRIAYFLAIVLGLLVFAATLWDIIFNDSELQWILLPLFLAIILWEVILLFSRRRHLQEVAELEAMHRTYLECDHCKSVFQFGELNFGNRKRVGFTCPVCAEESALPGPDAQPVERILPDARVLEATYACGHCSEQMVVGTFGATPRESLFRACPNCGTAGKVALA